MSRRRSATQSRLERERAGTSPLSISSNYSFNYASFNYDRIKERIRDTPPTAVERQHFTNLYGRAGIFPFSISSFGSNYDSSNYGRNKVRESRGIPLPTMADRQQFANLFGSPTRAERRNFANLYGPRTAAESQHMTDLLRRAGTYLHNLI